MLVKFEQNRVVQIFEFFDKKLSFFKAIPDKALTSFRKTFL